MSLLSIYIIKSFNIIDNTSLLVSNFLAITKVSAFKNSSKYTLLLFSKVITLSLLDTKLIFKGLLGATLFSAFKFLTLTIMSLIIRSEDHTSELQSRPHLVCRLLLEKK